MSIGPYATINVT